MTDNFTTVVDREQLTEEILDAAVEVYVGWFSDQERIDWSEFIDRLDGSPLDDGTMLDLGCDLTSGAITAIKEHIRRYRKEAG